MGTDSNEQAFFFDARGRRLFGVYHPPAGRAPPRAALIFVHSLLEEQKSAHRMLVETARSFAAAGMAVLRFDLAGCGDSQGELRNQSLPQWQLDIGAAADWLTARVAPKTPLGLVGIRFGARLALQTAPALPGVDRLVLWEPLTDGADWLRNRLRQRLARTMLAAAAGSNPRVSSAPTGSRDLDVDGFRMAPSLARAIENLRPVERVEQRFEGRTLILGIGPASRSLKTFETMAAALRGGGARVTLQNVGAPPFWNRLEPTTCPAVAATTLDWLLAAADKDTLAVHKDHRSGRDNIIFRSGAAGETGPVPRDFCVEAEKPLAFGKVGRRLTGIFHSAAGSSQRTPAVLFLHGWGAYRIGPHRMLVHAARRLAALGMPVLRFDFRGRGDSSGDVEATTVDSMIADSEAALKILENEAPECPKILLGMCSGAKIAAALAARRQDQVAGLILCSPEPPDASGQEDGRVSTLLRRGDIVRAYVRKLLDPAVWRKSLKGDLNWNLIGRALWGRRGAGADEHVRDRALYRDFSRYPGRRLLICGGADPDAAAACRAYRNLAALSGAEHVEQIIEDADHNFYNAAWERQVIDLAADWLVSLQQQFAPNRE